MSAMSKSILSLFGLLIVMEFVCIVALNNTVSELATSVRALNVSVSRLIDNAEPNMAGTFHASWTYHDATGDHTHEVNLTREAGETDAEWRDRCSKRVAADMALFPPV